MKQVMISLGFLTALLLQGCMTDPPEGIENLDVSPGAGEALVYWEAVSSAKSYQVSVLEDSDKGCSTTETQCIVTGLTPGASYSFVVRAKNSGGKSKASVAVYVTLETAPAAPGAVKAVAGVNKATISWQSPEVYGGLPVLGYKAWAVEDSTKSCTLSYPETVAKSCVVIGLFNETAYTFRVRATNAVGPGTASNATPPVTPSTIPGINWNRGDSTPQGLTNSVIWAGNQFVAVGITSPPFGNQTGTVMTSPDGVIWTVRASQGLYLRGVVWSGTQFVAVGSLGNILYSPNGVSWTLASSAFGSLPVHAVAWSGTQFMAVAYNGTIASSPTGVTWTVRSTDPAGLLALNGIVWTGNQFVAIGENNSVRTSVDGLTWVSRGAGPSGGAGLDLFAVAWTGSLLVAVGESGLIKTSPDGVTWTLRTSGTTNSFTDVIWAGNQLVAITGTEIFTSPDGVTWTKRVTGSTDYLNAVVWTGSKLVAFGNKVVLLSP